jgi:hypothetical protein
MLALKDPRDPSAFESQDFCAGSLEEEKHRQGLAVNLPRFDEAGQQLDRQGLQLLSPPLLRQQDCQVEPEEVPEDSCGL